jgi:hypothetical protein
MRCDTLTAYRQAVGHMTQPATRSHSSREKKPLVVEGQGVRSSPPQKLVSALRRWPKHSARIDRRLVMQSTLVSTHDYAAAHSDAGELPQREPTGASGAGPVAFSPARIWTGRILSGLVSAFFLFDSALKVLELIPASASTQQLGYPLGTLFAIGVIELICIVTYLIPRLSLVGAVLLTGYLGGAIATHVRVESPLFSHTLFPIYVALLVWGGLYLRDRRVYVLIAPRG